MILLVPEYWVLLASMKKMVEGANMGFLSQITGNQERRIMRYMWATLALGEVQETSGTQYYVTYIGHREGTVSQWVALRTIFRVCTMEKGYEGGGIHKIIMVAIGSYRKTAQDNLGGDLAG